MVNICEEAVLKGDSADVFAKWYSAVREIAPSLELKDYLILDTARIRLELRKQRKTHKNGSKTDASPGEYPDKG